VERAAVAPAAVLSAVGRIASHIKLVTARGHVTAQLVNQRWRPRYTTVVRKTEYVTGGRSRYRGNAETTEPLGPRHKWTSSGKMTTGNVDRVRSAAAARTPRACAWAFGPSAAILYTVLCSRTHGTTPHSLHGHPFLITRAHARARALSERIYGDGVISGHTDAHTVTLTHTRVEQFVCASLLVEPNLTSSTLHTTTTTAAAVN